MRTAAHRMLRPILLGSWLCAACSGCELIVDFDRERIGETDAAVDGSIPDAMVGDGARPDGEMPDAAVPDATTPLADASMPDAGETPRDAGMDATTDAGEMPFDGSVPVDAAVDGGDAGGDAG